MPTKSIRCWTLIASTIVFLTPLLTRASVIYGGNGNTSFGGAVGNGSLTLNDNGTAISGTFTKGTSGAFNDVIVIYINSVANGFTSTSGFNDRQDDLRRAISGVSDSGRSTATFAGGFAADYAIAFGVNGPNFGGLWQLANGNNNSLGFIASVNLTPTTGTGNPTYSFSVNWSDIGLTANTPGASFDFVSTYLAASGFRSGETFGAANLSGTTGWNDFTFGGYDTYITAVPEPVNVALGLFATLLGACYAFRRIREGQTPGV